MTDHALVNWTLDRLASNYTEANVSTSTPRLIDGDDKTVSRIDNGTRVEEQRRFSPDVADTNLVTVASSPDRQDTPIGTSYDLRVVDAVNILIEGAHATQTGEIENPDQFTTLKDEIRRSLLVDRTTFPSINGVDYHSLVPANAARPPAARDANEYFAYTFDLEFRGYETLP